MISNENDGNDEVIPLLNRSLPKTAPTYQSVNQQVHLADRAIPVFSGESSTRLRIVYSWKKLNVYEDSSLNDSAYLQSWGTKRRRENSTKNLKHILKNVCGIAYPGEILAVMGPSGAGKSTLLNAMTLQTTSTGCRYLNGCLIRSRHTLARLSAFVEQNTLFIGTLTVKEHLIFHAMLRMSRTLSYREKAKRVEEVISQLGLEKCQNVVIGSMEGIKGISGGEMKRLAFGTEILTDPPLMFCDEPTSGLDSFSALNLTKILKGLASNGKTVICTFHQPSSEMLSLFDKILFLTEGRTAYLGHLSDSFQYLTEKVFPITTKTLPNGTTSNTSNGFPNRLGVAPHPHHTLSDVFIRLLSVVPDQEEASREKIHFVCDYFDESIYGREIDSEIDAIKRNQVHIACNYFKNFQEKSPLKNSENHRMRASWSTQFRALCWRSWLNTIKEPLLLKVRLFQTLVLSLAVGLIYQNQRLNEDGVMNINGVLFTFLTSMTFQNMFAVINVFCSELPIFLKEHSNSLYGVEVYFLSKTLAEIPVFLLIPTVFTTLTYFWIGLNSGFENFMNAILILILVTNSATSFGYFISSISKNVLMALSIGPPVIISFLLFGGYLLNVGSIPPYFQWLSYFSWFKYGNEALLINQWSTVEKIDCFQSDSTCPKNGSVVLEAFHFRQDNFSRDLVFLFLLIIIFRFFAYSGLLLRVACNRK